MSQDRRLEKVEASLTAKQAVVKWLEEIREFRNPTEYVQFLRTQPESAAPMTRLTGQVGDSVRETMKGRPKELIVATVRRAVKDVVFLLKLHLQVNFKLLSEQRAWSLILAFLTEMQGRIFIEQTLRGAFCMTGLRLSVQTPYPVDAQMAAAVKAAINHNVITWEQLEDQDTVQDWLYDYYVDQGAKELPENCYELEGRKLRPRITPENESKVRACFRDEAEFERYRSGVDYTNGLSSINDAEWNAHYDQIVMKLHEIVDSGEVQAGTLVKLETVSIPFLQEAPLVEGQWLDRYILELAEYGKVLRSQGREQRGTEDEHPLAQASFLIGDGKEADPVEMQRARRRVARNLEKFQGRTKKIDGRIYINNEDSILKGKARRAFIPGLEKGLVTASWNSWVEAHGGEDTASIMGVPVMKLECYVGQASYYVCENVQEQLQRRSAILEGLRTWQPKPERRAEQLKSWRRIAEVFLTEIYAFQEALNRIRRSYFGFHSILFADSEQYLADLTTEASEIVMRFNDLANGEREQYQVDLDIIRKSAGLEANEQVTLLVDMAKSEALDALGEYRGARNIAEKYL